MLTTDSAREFPTQIKLNIFQVTSPHFPGNSAGKNKPGGKMNASMTILSEYEMTEIEGGNPLLVVAGMAIGAYMKLVDKVEENPNEYTWLMDWYYS